MRMIMSICIDKVAVADIGVAFSAHNVHDQYKDLTVDQRRNICEQESLDYDVAIINVTGELNLGNIIRSSSLCGARRVWILGRRRYDPRGTVGSEHYIETIRINMIDENNLLTVKTDEVFALFNEQNLHPIFIEQYNDDCQKIKDTQDLSNTIAEINKLGCRPVVVFGNENRGVPESLISMYSTEERFVYELSQRGVIRSFNVGSSAAIVLYNMMTVLAQ